MHEGAFYMCVPRRGDSEILDDEEDCDLDTDGIKAGRVVGSRLPDGRAIRKLRMEPFATYHSVLRPSLSIATAFAMHHRIRILPPQREFNVQRSTTDKGYGTARFLARISE
jgi:hypothetical protein